MCAKRFDLKSSRKKWDKPCKRTKNGYSATSKQTRNYAVRSNHVERNMKLNITDIDEIDIQFGDTCKRFDAFNIDYQAKNPMTESEAKKLVGVSTDGEVYTNTRNVSVNDIQRLIKFLFKKIHFLQLQDDKRAVVPVDDWTWKQIQAGKEIEFDEDGRYVDVIGEKPKTYTDILAQKAIKLIPYGWPYGYTNTMYKEAKVYKKGDETRIYEPYSIRECFEDDEPRTIKPLVQAFEKAVRENKGKEVLMGAVVTLSDHEHAIPLSIKYKNGKIRVIAFNTNGSGKSKEKYAEPICKAINQMWSNGFFSHIGGQQNVEYFHRNFNEQKDGTCLTTSELEVRAMLKGDNIGEATDDLTTWYTAFTNAAQAHLCKELGVERKQDYSNQKHIQNVRSNNNVKKYSRGKRVNFLPK